MNEGSNMKCETCGNDHDGSYGSGRFCTAHCARKFSTMSDDKSDTKMATCISCGFPYKINKRRSATNFICDSCKGIIKKCDYGCGIEAHYQQSNGKWCCSETFYKCSAVRKRNSDSVKKAYSEGRKDLVFSDEHRLKSRETWNERFAQLPIDNMTHERRKQIVLEEQNYRCLHCGINEWNGKSIILELDHIDGNNTNNQRNNLRCLCPNCHSQTHTWKRGMKSTNKPKATEEEILNAIKTSTTYSEALEKCNMGWGSIKRLKRVEKKYNIYIKE